MTNQFNLGHFVRLKDDTQSVVLALQNFFISTTIEYENTNYIFSPFGFTGTSVDRQAALAPAELIFPANPISRGYLSDALRGMTFQGAEGRPWRRPYYAEVDVMNVNVEDQEAGTKIMTYTGQCTAGGWDDTRLTLELSSIFDAASANIPTRTLTQRIVGSLPTSSRLNLR